MKKIILVFGILLLNIFLVSANGDHQSEIEEGKKLVESDVDCDKLNDEQLEAIGEYLMEQMHPGEAHEMMDKMMGGEGSESLKQMHIQMAKRIYCNEDVGGMMGSGGMMPMMMNMMGGNMMGSGMMGNLGYGFGYLGFWNIIWLLFLIGILVLIFWLIYKFVIQKGKNEYPLDILQKRFAKGEINKKQFEEMKKEIGE